jgi:hypothetical protein
MCGGPSRYDGKRQVAGCERRAAEGLISVDLATDDVLG